MSSIDEEIRRKNAALTVLWAAVLLIVGAAVAVLVRMAFGQVYDVSLYLTVEASATVLTLALAALWLRLTTSTSGWIITQTCLASLLFILISFGIAAGAFFLCPAVYTPDGRNFLQLTAAFILPATFTALMYACPPVHVSEVILPGCGAGQVAARTLLALAALALAAQLFWYDFH